MKKDELKIGGARIRTFAPPPSGFDAVTATPQKLRYHGIPTRPDAKLQPKLYKAWHGIFSKKLNHIVPEFLELPHIQHGPVKKRPKIQNTSTSNNWSGAVVTRNNDPFKWISGNWIVPNPCSATPGLFFSSAWVGIDGWGSGDVLQAGTEQDIFYLPPFVTSRTVYAWWEWFPANSVQISNFPVNAGDTMTCLICVNSTTSATIFMTNLNTLNHVSFSITAPSGTSLVGNSAEWVVERPTVNGSVAQLPDYGTVYFDSAFAETDSNTFLQAKDGDNINMTNGSDVISEGFIPAEQIVKCAAEV